MRHILSKTFGGLSRQSYVRHLLFGAIIPTMMYYDLYRNGYDLSISKLSFLIVSIFLYPYSRFVYESVVDYIVGANVFIVNAWLSLFVKLLTMTFCWACAIYIAPVGLCYLYYHHSKECKRTADSVIP